MSLSASAIAHAMRSRRKKLEAPTDPIDAQVAEHQEYAESPQVPAVPDENEDEIHMAKGGDVLDAEARKHIAKKNFAGPDKSYPIEDMAHARNALARVAQHGSPELQKEVREKVHSKYPSIGEHAEGGEIEDDKRKKKAKAILSRMGK